VLLAFDLFVRKLGTLLGWGVPITLRVTVHIVESMLPLALDRVKLAVLTVR
jgi:hypothetical protein